MHGLNSSTKCKAFRDKNIFEVDTFYVLILHFFFSLNFHTSWHFEHVTIQTLSEWEEGPEGKAYCASIHPTWLTFYANINCHELKFLTRLHCNESKKSLQTERKWVFSQQESSKHRWGTDLRKTPLLWLRISRCVAHGCRVMRRGCSPSDWNSSLMSDGNKMFTLLRVPTFSLSKDRRAGVRTKAQRCGRF